MNLTLAIQGMYLAAAIALVAPVMKAHQQRAAFALFGRTLATCVYRLVTVPLLTPRDNAHLSPRALAAVLIFIGFLPDLNVGLSLDRLRKKAHSSESSRFHHMRRFGL